MVLKPSTTLQEIFENEIELPDFGPERNLILSALNRGRWMAEGEMKKEDIYAYFGEDSEERKWLDSHPDKIYSVIDAWNNSLGRNGNYWETYWMALESVLEMFMEEEQSWYLL